jgi:hypothetical protein
VQYAAVLTRLVLLSACSAGPHSLGFVYQLAAGQHGVDSAGHGLTNERVMSLSINGQAQKDLHFPATGGWREGDWREIFAQVQPPSRRSR